MQFKYRLLLMVGLLLTLSACSSTPPGPNPNPSPGDTPGAGVPFSGTLTLDDYDWFTVTSRLGVIDIDLSSGQKTRVLDGAYPWRHPSGKITFAQGCGEDVSLIAVAEGGLITPITPCSSEISNPGASPTRFDFSRLSPDQQRVAVGAGYFLNGDFRYNTLVFDLSGTLLATFEDATATAWLPDGRLLLAGNGVYVTDAQLQNLVRADNNQLNGPVGNMDVHPSGTLVALEYNQQIWLLDLATTSVSQLVSGAKRLAYPTFSPDGAAIAYLATADKDRYDQVIYFNDLQTGEPYALDFPDSNNVSNVPNGPLSWTQ